MKPNDKYAVYKGKEYRAAKLRKDKLEIIGNDKDDLKLGFKRYERPDIFEETAASFPEMYIKEVGYNDLEELYKLDYKVRYKNELLTAGVFRDGNRIQFGTGDKLIAERCGIPQIERGWYDIFAKVEDLDKMGAELIPIKTDLLEKYKH